MFPDEPQAVQGEEDIDQLLPTLARMDAEADWKPFLIFPDPSYRIDPQRGSVTFTIQDRSMRVDRLARAPP